MRKTPRRVLRKRRAEFWETGGQTMGKPAARCSTETKAVNRVVDGPKLTKRERRTLRRKHALGPVTRCAAIDE